MQFAMSIYKDYQEWFGLWDASGPEPTVEELRFSATLDLA